MPSAFGEPRSSPTFAGIYMQQDQLHPRFRSMIENDEDEDQGDDDDSSSSNGAEVVESSTYETAEEGETTDEDFPPPESIARTRSVLRRPSWSSVEEADDDLRSTGLMRRPGMTGKGRRRGPSLGSWIADPSKPIAVVDGSGKRLVIYPAQKPSPESPTLLDPPRSSDASTIGGSPRAPLRGGSFSEVETDRNDFSSQELLSPTLSPGASLMMGSLMPSSANNSTRRPPFTEFIIPGRFFTTPRQPFSSPFMPVSSTKRSAAQFDLEDDDDDDEEKLLNVQDFINFGDDDDDDGEKMLNVQDFINFGDDSSDDGGDHGDVGRKTKTKTKGKGKPMTKKAKTSGSGSGGKLVPVPSSAATRKRRMSAGGGMGWMASSVSMGMSTNMSMGMGMNMGMMKMGKTKKIRGVQSNKRIRSC